MRASCARCPPEPAPRAGGGSGGGESGTERGKRTVRRYDGPDWRVDVRSIHPFVGRRTKALTVLSKVLAQLSARRQHAQTNSCPHDIRPRDSPRTPAAQTHSLHTQIDYVRYTNTRTTRVHASPQPTGRHTHTHTLQWTRAIVPLPHTVPPPVRRNPCCAPPPSRHVTASPDSLRHRRHRQRQSR